MKTQLLLCLAVCTVLLLISCDKPGTELESKLDQMEKKVAEAEERRIQLELEMANQRMMAEAEAIERERALIDRERIAMEEAREADQAAFAADLVKRQAELVERESNLSALQENLDSRERQLTGLEGQLSERELNRAGLEPLNALSMIENTYANRPTGDFSNFYEPLGDYGSWLETADYGYVYQPTVVRDVSWRPYTRGRWAFTDHGWTWVSSEPFGWACYHYGRWALLRGTGWVWVPGSEWAPAWVTWRESAGYIGWAPLPPETLAWRGRSWDSSVEVIFGIGQSWFSFVSYKHFGNHIQSYCLPVTQNTGFFRSTRNVTNYRIHSGRVFVGGPAYRNVSERIGRPFPIHRLRMDQSPDFGRGGRRFSPHFSGNELRVVAPRMDADWNQALRPTRVSRDLGRVAVERSRELSEDIRNQFRNLRREEIRQAERVVSVSGGRERFESERMVLLEQGRQQATARRDRNASRNRSPDSSPQADRERPMQSSVDAISERSLRLEAPKRPLRPNRPEAPEVSQASTKSDQTGENQVPPIPDNPSRSQTHQTLDPAIPQQAVEPPQSPRPNRPGIVERGSREGIEQSRRGAVEKAANELSERAEERRKLEEARRQQQEARRVQGEQEKQQEIQDQQQERTRREQAQQERADEQQRQMREQQERVRQEQEQQERARQQQEQQERARQQQERLRQEQEQQERVRQQQEQQERARQEQEQQERARQQQEQQERARQQQEQQERARQQQERARQQES